VASTEIINTLNNQNHDFRLFPFPLKNANLPGTERLVPSPGSSKYVEAGSHQVDWKRSGKP